MKRVMTPSMLAVALLLAPCAVAADAPEPDEDGFVSMFDGETLDGWDGKPGGWWVEDGALTAESTAENPCHKSHYVFWEGGEPGDFVLRFQYRVSGEGGNSGVQFRSERRPDYDVWGYQADIETGDQWTGCLFQHDRGGVVMRGYKAVIQEDGSREETQFADPEELLEVVRDDDWNDYEVVAKGPHITLRINGELMCAVEDHDKEYSRDAGVIALQKHAGPPMKIAFRNLRIKLLD